MQIWSEGLIDSLRCKAYHSLPESTVAAWNEQSFDRPPGPLFVPSETAMRIRYLYVAPSFWVYWLTNLNLVLTVKVVAKLLSMPKKSSDLVKDGSSP